MPKVALVIFDMAGTTVHDDGYVAECFIAALATAGIPVSPEEVRPVMGIPKPLAIQTLLEQKTGRSSPQQIDQLHQLFLSRMIALYQTDPRVREIEGATTVFQQLRQAGIKVALDTGFSRDIADTILQRLAWGDLIDASVTSDEVAQGRPAPDMALKIMATLGISDPQKVAKIGDTHSDLGEGAELGAGFNIGVTSGAYTYDQLVSAPHTHILESIREIPALLL